MHASPARCARSGRRRELRQLASGGGGELPAHRRGHDVVAPAVHEKRWNLERQPPRRATPRGSDRAHGREGLPAAARPCRRTPPGPRPARGRRRAAWPTTAESGTRGTLPSCGPQGEMAARGVADRGDPPQVERCVELGEVVDRRGHVVERRRPAAAGPEADAPVLDVPRRPSPLCEVGGQPVHEVAVVPRTPAASVDEDHDRMRARSVGEGEVGDLAPVAPVPVERAVHLAAGRTANGTMTGAGRSG